MDRKRYLELCQKNSVYPKSVIVSHGDIDYYPEKLQIWFDKDGKTKNTAVMSFVVGNGLYLCDVEKVVEKNEK